MVSEILELIKARRKRAEHYSLDLPPEKARYAALDTELTGLDEKKDQIISIGAVRVEEGRIVVADSFYTLVKPDCAFRKESVVIHGITPSDVQAEPCIADALDGFRRFCGGDVIVGHCVSIDLAFLNREFRKASGSGLENPGVDTYQIHEWLLRSLPSYRGLFPGSADPGLYSIAGRMGISINGAHNAEMDAYITAQVFQRYLRMLPAAGVSRLGDLLRIADPFKGGGNLRTANEIVNF